MAVITKFVFFLFFLTYGGSENVFFLKQKKKHETGIECPVLTNTVS